MSEQLDPTPRDYAAYALAKQITTLTRLYIREVEEFIHQRDMRGAHAREERFEEEVLEACLTANAANHDTIKRIREELVGILYAELKPSNLDTNELAEYLKRQEEWSARTFGQGTRTLGICKHSSRELTEIGAEPHDLSEWVDVMILAMDGYWRHSGDPKSLMAELQAKQDKNFARQWPAPGPQDEPTEHVR